MNHLAHAPGFLGIPYREVEGAKLDQGHDLRPRSRRSSHFPAVSHKPEVTWSLPRKSGWKRTGPEKPASLCLMSPEPWLAQPVFLSYPWANSFKIISPSVLLEKILPFLGRYHEICCMSNLGCSVRSKLFSSLTF